MVEQEFQRAIEKMISDETYSRSLTVDPGRLAKDFGLNGKQILALKPTDTPGMHGGNVRPVSFCCCTCLVAQSPAEIDEAGVK